MIQELVALLDQKEKEQYLARAEQFPFPTRVLVRGLDLRRPIRARSRRLRRSTANWAHEHRAGAVADLRAIIVEKLGNSTGSGAHTALRDLYRQKPGGARRDRPGPGGPSVGGEPPHPGGRARFPRFEHDEPGPSRPGPAQVLTRRVPTRLPG